LKQGNAEAKHIIQMFFSTNSTLLDWLEQFSVASDGFLMVKLEYWL